MAQIHYGLRISYRKAWVISWVKVGLILDIVFSVSHRSFNFTPTLCYSGQKGMRKAGLTDSLGSGDPQVLVATIFTETHLLKLGEEFHTHIHEGWPFMG